MTNVVLITGASSGFGTEFSRIFASKGHNLLIVARSEDKLTALKKSLEKRYGIKVFVLSQDLSIPDAAHRVEEFVNENNLAVDILINNAGFGDYGRFVDSDISKLSNMIDLNDRSLVEMTHTFLPSMVKNGKGKILNVASIASFEAGPQMAVYYASKAFVLSFTESLSEELRDTGVTLTALCPGPTDTGFSSAAQMPAGRFANMFRFTKPLDVAKYGYIALMKGQVIAIPGILNRLAIIAVKLLPRAFVRKAVGILQK
ncbi:MAG: SDR family oxidoreductase [Butyrivibrio sp.]|nr:SDR family oxidoreductase [Butyrivibrio sp.]